MASSMLFQANSASSGITQYSQPGVPTGNLTPMGTYIRITSIWLYNTSSGTKQEVAEDQYPDDALPANTVKYLYVDPGGYYVRKQDVNYIQNFYGDFQNSNVVNCSGTLSRTTNGLYGPNPNSPVKSPNIPNGTSVIWVREYGDFVYLQSPTNVWVPRSAINNTTAETSAESQKVVSKVAYNSNSVHDNNYSYDPGNVTMPSPNPDRVIKGSGSENLIYKDNIKALIQSSGIVNRKNEEWYNKFNRFGYIDPYNTLTTTREYAFFTKPDLHIFNGSSSSSGLNEEISNLAIFDDAYYRFRPVLEQLQWSVNKNNPFANILSNSVKSTLELPSISADEIDTASNIYGTRLTYRKSSHQSDESFDFSIEFEDTKYLEVYMFFKLFDEYQKRKMWGEITPPDTNYIFNKILHDQISIYKFIVGEDGMSLIYWAKYTGCYPKTVPRESFSDLSSDSGGLKLSVQWKAQFVEDMDPQILTDFNTLIEPLYSASSSYLPIYNNDIQAIDGRWASTPYISQRQLTGPNNVGHRYQLNWRV